MAAAEGKTGDDELAAEAHEGPPAPQHLPLRPMTPSPIPHPLPLRPGASDSDEGADAAAAVGSAVGDSEEEADAAAAVGDREAAGMVTKGPDPGPRSTPLPTHHGSHIAIRNVPNFCNHLVF